MKREGSVVCFGELLLRLTAPGAQLLLQTPILEVAYGGAEANVAVSLSCFGEDTRLISALPDNVLGAAMRAELRRHGVDVAKMRAAQGRMGLYFLTPGAGVRAPEVTYDRANSAFVNCDWTTHDWRAALVGGGWFHVSGVTAALGDGAAQAALAGARAARAAGMTMSFDGNYRATLWAERVTDAPVILRALMAEADVLFGDHRDISLALGAQFECSDVAAEAAFVAFPNLSRIVHTERVEHSVSRHDLSARMYVRTHSWHESPIVLSDIVDRVGGGDAFAAGVIHALRRGWEGDAVLKFALAAAALKHATPGDWNLAREQDVFAVLLGAGPGVRR
jgi:2-dehydro-3-deoxygluconokinase